MRAYDMYLSGSLQDYEVTDEDVSKNIAELEKII